MREDGRVTSKLAIVGGTGQLGSGLARRWVAAGHAVVLGSRDPGKAAAAAAALAAEIGGRIEGASNLEAARAAEIVVVAVPFASHEATLVEIAPAVAGKIVVDAVVPLVPPRVAVAQLPPEGSAARIAARLLPEARVVSAFHNVAAAKLASGEAIECDTLVFGDDAEAKAAVIALADAAGTRGIDGGALANSAAAEAFTSVLIGLNRRYRVGAAGLRITGIG